MPFVRGAAEVTVAAEEFDDVDAMEDAELVLWMVLRAGTKMPPLTSSGVIALIDCPPHACRLMLGKLGGLATAVMEKTGRRSGSMGEGRFG